MRAIIAIAIAVIGVITFSSEVALGQTCTLVGQQATLDVASPVAPGSATATVQADVVEFNPAPGDGRFSVDVEASSIRMFNNTASTNVLFNNPTTYTVTLSGASVPTIVGISVAINGVAGFSASNVAFTANSVTFTVTGSTWHGGDSVVVTLQTTCPPSSCTLVGQQATLDVASPVAPGSATATVQTGGVEFNPAPGDGRFSVDVEASSIRMFNNTASTNVLFNNPTTYTITLSGASVPTIVGISVAINGVAGFSASNVAFTANSVTFTVTGSTWHGGDNVVVTLQPACAPPPMPTQIPTFSAWALILLVGLLLLAARRARRRVSE